MARRILRAMQILELSAVDTPAQEGARFVLAKRADPGLTHPPVDDANSDKDKSGEGTMTDAEKLAKAEKDLADVTAKAVKDLADVTAEKDLLAKMATLSDADKAHFAALKELDADGATKFLAMDAAARKVEIEKAMSADPVIYTDSEGHEYHKSEAKAASLAKRADDMAKENKALKDAQTAVSFEKRAAEFPHLKGELVIKCALLRAVDAITDEATKVAVTEMLKANDAGLAEAMKTLGTQIGGVVTSEPEAKLNTMAEDKAKVEKISFAKAYDAVVQTPEGAALYKELIEAKAPKAA